MSNRSSSRFATLKVAAVAACLVSATPALAGTIDFQGSTLGCFGAGCGDFGSPKSPGYGLTFTGSSFDLTSALDGTASLDFGTVSRDNTAYTTSDPVLDFTLQVTFVLPSGIDGGQASTFDATFAGTMSSNGSKLAIDFLSNAWQLYTFTDAFGTGSFELMIADPGETPKNNSADLVGSVRNATYVLSSPAELPPVPAPEPASLLLLGTGLTALALRRRSSRRR